MSESIGYATLQIIPSMRGFDSKVKAGLNDQAGRVGDESGRNFGKRFNDSAGKSLGQGNLAEKLKTLAKVAAISGAVAFGAGATILGFGIHAAAQLETTTTSFTALLGSATAAQQQIVALQKYAAATPFAQQDVFGYAQQFYTLANSVGLSRDQLFPFLDAVGNLGAVTGASTANIHNAVMAIGQIGSSGKVTLDNLNQISEAFPGFNGAAAIANATGQTTAQVMKQISAGTLDAKTGVNALLVGMQKFPGAAGAMGKQSETLNGLWSTFTDTIKISLTQAFGPLIPVIKSALSTITPIIKSTLDTLAPILSTFVKQFTPIIGPLIQSVGKLLGAFFKVLGPAFKALTPVIAPLTKLIVTMLHALSPVITLLAQIVAQVGPPLINLFTTLWAAIAPVVQALVSALGPVLPIIAQAMTDVVIALQPLITALSGAFIQVIKAIGPSLPLIETAIAALAVAFASLVGALTPLIPPLTQIVIAFVTKDLAKVVLTLASALTTVIQAVTPLIPLLVGLLNLAVKPLTAAFTAIGDTVSFVWTSVLKPVFKGILDAFITVVGGIVSAADDMFSWVPFVGSKLDHARDAIYTFRDQANAAFADIQPVITPVIDPSVVDYQLALMGDAINGGITTAKIPFVGPVYKKQPPKTPGFSVPKNIGGGGSGSGSGSSTPKFDASALTAFAKSISGAASDVTDAFKALVKSGEDSHKFSTKFVKSLTTEDSALTKLVSKRNDYANKLKVANDKLAAVKQSYADEKSSVAQGVTGTFDVANAGSAYNDRAVNATDILAQLDKAVANAGKFSATFKALAKRGLPQGLLQQLAAAGPAALPQALALLAATPSTFASIKSDFSKLGSIGSDLGTFTAKSFYGAGVASGQGIVDGLKSQESAIEKAVEKLAKAMIAQVRKTLGIHSPSTVMYGLGGYTVNGFTNAIDDGVPAAQKSFRNLMNMPTPRSQTGRWAGDSGGGTTVDVKQYITPGMDPEATANATARHLRRLVV